MKIGGKEFDSGTYVMGILNVTPDSFSDGGKYNDVDRAVRHAQKLIKDGADIIDVGGESTRPDYIKISEDEEISRVLPVLEKIKLVFDIPVSVDTYKAGVANAAADAGADMINDIWGLKYDNGEMARVIAKRALPCCLTHNRADTDYSSFTDDVIADLRDSVKIAESAGIGGDKIILDPGVGFAKTYEQNLTIINRLDRIVALGYPVLLGTSRKSVIGLTLDLPAEERLEGTIATTVMAVEKGCRFVRVHDVLENKRAIKMAEAVINEGKNNG